MSTWLSRLLESAEDKKNRQFKEMSSTDEFKRLLKIQATEIINETKQQAIAEINAKEAAQIELLEDAETNIAVLSKEMEDSKKPHVIIRSLDFTVENGIEIKLDFNQAFIKYLNTNGITGNNEDEVIRKWLAHLSQDIITQTTAEDYLLNGVGDDEQPDMGLKDILQKFEEEDNEQDEFNS